MNIGFIGLGKLGLPCALAVESRGHKVIGYDPSEQVKDIIESINNFKCSASRNISFFVRSGFSSILFSVIVVLILLSSSFSLFSLMGKQ